MIPQISTRHRAWIQNILRVQRLQAHRQDSSARIAEGLTDKTEALNLGIFDSKLEMTFHIYLDAISTCSPPLPPSLLPA